MSRCFPFPPPGYEKKPRPEDANILKEEKQKEKKPKKEKKEKEKREGKEKKVKERSDEKHKEKRDRKEKHKDRKGKHREKNKEDKSKEKERSRSSEASKVTSLPEARSGEKLNSKEGKDNSYCSDEKNREYKFHGQNGDKRVQSNFPARETEESKFVQELGRRTTEEKAACNQFVDRFSAAKERDDEIQRSAVRNLGDLAEEKGKSSDKGFENKKMDVQGIEEEARFSGNSMVQSLAGTAKGKVERVPGVVDKIDERKMEGKEKRKEKDDKRGDKHKKKDRDKKGHGKDKDREKERKKEEKSKEKSELKKHELDESKDVNRSGDLVGFHDKNCSNLSSNHNSNASVEGNFKKRKDRDINGFLHDYEIRPNKLPRPASHPVMENGRKLEACQTPSLSSSEKQGIGNLKVDNMEDRKNGIIEFQSLPPAKLNPKPKPPPVTADIDLIVEASKKPPHPDTKYLSQVLSVPKMGGWSELDDQEWLFGSQDPPSRKPEAGSPSVGEERQVWCEALYIESADVVALPYVLPY